MERTDLLFFIIFIALFILWHENKSIKRRVRRFARIFLFKEDYHLDINSNKDFEKDIRNQIKDIEEKINKKEDRK